MVSFSQVPAVKKDTVFGAARNFFGPSHFVTALGTSTKEYYILSRCLQAVKGSQLDPT